MSHLALPLKSVNNQVVTNAEAGNKCVTWQELNDYAEGQRIWIHNSSSYVSKVTMKLDNIGTETLSLDAHGTSRLFILSTKRKESVRTVICEITLESHAPSLGFTITHQEGYMSHYGVIVRFGNCSLDTSTDVSNTFLTSLSNNQSPTLQTSLEARLDSNTPCFTNISAVTGLLQCKFTWYIDNVLTDDVNPYLSLIVKDNK